VEKRGQSDAAAIGLDGENCGYDAGTVAAASKHAGTVIDLTSIACGHV
jgi:hypothetical protein